VKVDDAVLECVEKRFGVDSVVAGIDNKLDRVQLEEVTHRDVALLGRLERLLRELAQRNALLARELRSAARRSVGRDRDDVEATLDQVAEIRALARNRDADSEAQRMTTRSGPV
jgi:cytidylate kinase